MSFSEIINSGSSSASVKKDSTMTTTTDNENKSHISTAKKIKLSPSHDFKNEGSNEDVLPESSNKKVELLFPNSSLSPEECALSIDHIRESIFLKCDRKTVMNCRLVSRRWAYYGSKALQKTVLITLHEYFSRPDEPPIFWCGSSKARSMKNLITLMNNSTEFPASSFHLRCGFRGKTKRTAQPFFDAHGALIKKIILEGDLWIDDFKQLILTQAPYLEQLHLVNHLNIKNRNSSQNVDLAETNEQRLERTRLETSLFDETLATKSQPILKNLKVFKCSSSVQIPEVFIRQILECTPNLVEVVLPEDCLHFLVQPTNRLHLLRKLELRINSPSIESVEAVANHCHEGNWGVRHLRYLGGDGWDVRNTEFERRVASIMSKILSACSKTCKKLKWLEHPEHFKIPEMPQVEQLTFHYYENDDTGYPVNILPEGVSLADTFPNLKCLIIRSVVSMKDLPIENIFGDDDPVPVPSVKKVILRFFDFGDNLRQSFQTMFPNATIHNKVGCYNNDEESKDNGNEDNERDSDGDGNDVDEADDNESHDSDNNDDEFIDEEINKDDISEF